MKKKSMTLLIVLLVIGFAAVSTTLVLNGTIGIGTNNDNFVDGVVFDEESLSSSNGTTAEISESGRTITFTTQEMKSIDETAIVNFKIKNYSQYDAILGTPAISCYFVDEYQEDTVAPKKSDTHEYMTVTPGSELDGKTITAGGGLSDESSVTVKQKKSYAGDDTQTVKFQCVINATALESSSASIKKPLKMPEGYYLVNDINGNGIADTSDEIKIGTESFYVISNTGSEINALAKYNLNVGNNRNSAEKEGIQNEKVRGWLPSGMTMYGNVAFSNNKGWLYLNNETIDIKAYDGPVKDALYGENGYEKYLKKTILSSSIRLITYEELLALGCLPNFSTCGPAPSWVYSTSYWTGSAASNYDDRVWRVSSNAMINSDVSYSDTYHQGVRPVVVIPLN